MGFTLKNVVPWGRSFAEYVAMFDLTDVDLDLRVLGCGDGPAAFNSQLTRCGGSVVSVDPIYVVDGAQIRSRIAETYEAVMAQMCRNEDDYVWRAIPSVEELGRMRMSAMDEFLADFDAGKREGRYVAGELPLLPFSSGAFDMALSSHFLFLYSNHLSAEFHLQALEEMLRVAREVRVFPLVTLGGTLSPHLPLVSDHLAGLGFTVTTRRVPYEFQRGANEMLVAKPAESAE